MFISIYMKNILQTILCFIYLINFGWVLHKSNSFHIRPIVRVWFNWTYCVNFIGGFIMAAVLFYEALTYYYNCLNSTTISAGFFIWSFTSLSVLILSEIRRRLKHPVCNTTFSYLLFTNLLCLIRYFDHIYDINYINSNNEKEFSNIDIILILHFIQLIHASRSHFSGSNSVLRNENPCPEEYASTLSKILFMWLDRYIYEWYKNGFSAKSTFDLNYECEADINTLNLKRKLKEKLRFGDHRTENGSASWLFLSLFQVFYSKLLISWCAIIFHILFSFSRPFILKYFIKFINDPESPLIYGFIIAGSFLGTGILSSITQNFCLHLTSVTSLKIHSALVGVIFSKSLNVNNEAKVKYTNAEIVNLMSSDTEKVDTAVAYSWIIISSPFEILLTFAFLSYEVGSAAFIGIVILIATFPLNSLAMKWLQYYQTEEMNNKDKRIKAVSEVLNNIKVIKMYGWETYFFKTISTYRNEEVNLIKLGSMCTNFVNIIWDILPIVVLSSTFWSYNSNNPDNIITAETTFVSLVLFNMIRSPMAVLPYGISIAMNGYVSLRRIGLFLGKPDAIDYCLNYNDDLHSNLENEESIKISDGFFSCRLDSEPVLKNINLSIPRGQLVGIIGKVASGKTSLLNAIIGELCIIQGEVNIKGSVSYVTQSPWIQKASAKENILFAKRYDEQYYQTVIKACGLDFDLKNITKGDIQSEDNDLLFSGGQKQRINLARAVYQKSNIYLLDDPLSAVDDIVGKTIFQRVISNSGILAGSTRVFVTQNIKWLAELDRIIILNQNGSITYDGDYTNLKEDVIEFMKMNEIKKTEEIDLKELFDENFEMSNNSSFQIYKSNRFHKPIFVVSQKKTRLNYVKHQIKNAENINENNSSNFDSPNEFNDTEFSFKIKCVSFRTYLNYFLARGNKLCFLSLVTFGAMTALQVFSNYWLEKMTSQPYETSNNTLTYLNNDQNKIYLDNNNYNNYYIVVYTCIGLGQILSAFGFYTSFSLGSANASKILHDYLLRKVLNARLKYFHKSNSHILNCFSKDIDNIDNMIPGNLSEVINGIFQVLASIFVILYTFPIFILLIIPIGLLYYMMMSFYMPAACQTQMMCVNSSSPIFTHFNETLQGRPIIRASRQKKHFILGINRLLDENTKFLYIQNVLNLWLSLRLDVLGNLLMFGSVLMAICYKNVLTPSMVGLTISYSIEIIDLLNWLMIQYVELETNAMALERLKDFNEMELECNNVPSEVNKKDYDLKWPKCGKIEFRNVSLRYSKNLNYALKNISMSIESGEIIGIVGRTGSGKTSLVQSLFRFMEPTMGSIFIDGVNIQNISLNTLRKSITMFPQESSVFSGSILQNIDPYNQFTSYTLHSALKLSHLETWIKSIGNNLDFDCGENGSNLSVGQRQLLCLTRLILRNSKIIILDEATASVDQGTDKVIMKTIRERFISKTIIIIAHRIESLEHVDKIAVIENGSLIEYGYPKDVINSPDGYFSRFNLHNGQKLII